MFLNVFKKALNFFNKPHILQKINLWYINSTYYFNVKMTNTLIWFVTIFDKLQLNKIKIFNKKYEWDYIVRRNFFMLIVTIVWIIITILINT